MLQHWPASWILPSELVQASIAPRLSVESVTAACCLPSLLVAAPAAGTDSFTATLTLRTSARRGRHGSVPTSGQCNALQVRFCAWRALNSLLLSAGDNFLPHFCGRPLWITPYDNSHISSEKLCLVESIGRLYDSLLEQNTCVHFLSFFRQASAISCHACRCLCYCTLV